MFCRVLVVLLAVALGPVALTAAPATGATPSVAVTHEHVTAESSSSITVAWHNPASSRYDGVVVRVGKRAPASPRGGTAVASLGPSRHSVTVRSLTPGTRYTVALFPIDRHGGYGKRSTVRAMTGPASVQALVAARTDARVTLTWRNPTRRSFAGAVVRYARGHTAPAAPVGSAGRSVRLTSAKPTRVTVHVASSTTYTFAVWLRDRGQRYSSVRTVSVRTRALPGPVRAVHATPQTPKQIALSWRPPSSQDFSGVMLRRVTGTPSSVSISSGTLVGRATTATSFVDRSVPGPGSYTYALFAHDAASRYARAVLVRASTTALTTTPPAIQGVVRQAATSTGLSGVVVKAEDEKGGPVLASTTTRSDGSYSLKGVHAGTSYVLCFAAVHAVGPSATGYADSCLATQVTPSAVTVITGINGSLYPGAALRGTVTGAGAAVRSVQVRIYPIGAAADAAAIATATTDTHGHYAISALPHSATGYTACFDAGHGVGPSTTGFLSECRGGAAWQPASGVPAAAAVVPLAHGQVTTADEVLTRAGAIAGTVTADAVGGLAAVRVSVVDAAGVTVGSATTASDGSYTVTGLPANPSGYAVCFDGAAVAGAGEPGVAGECYRDVPWNGGPPPTASTLVPVTLATVSTAVDAVLSPAAAITGTVTASGVGVGGVVVQVYDAVNDVRSTTKTASDGSYTVTSLADADASQGYAVCFDPSKVVVPSTGYLGQCYDQTASGLYWVQGSVPPGTVARIGLTGGQIVRSVNAALAPAGAISGQVTAATGGAALAGVHVIVYNPAGVVAGTTTTAKNGTYRLARLGGGSYSLCFAPVVAPPGSTATGYLGQCWEGAQWTGSSSNLPWWRTRVVLGNGAFVTGKNAALTAAGSLAGTVTAQTGGAPLAGVEVQPFDSLGDPVGGPHLTSPDGTYLVTGLPPAKYGVCFDAAAARGGSSTWGYLDECYAGTSWTGDDLPAGLTQVRVTGGATRSKVGASLGTAAAISGRVVASGGAALAKVTVKVYDSTGSEAGVDVATAADGTYTVRSLSPGKYTVCLAGSAEHLGQCYKNQAWDGTDYAVPAASVVVKAGHTTTAVNATLAKAFSISGTVTATNATGLANVEVYAFDADGTEAARAVSGNDGTYTLRGLPASSYAVCFDASGAAGATTGYLSQCYRNVPWDGNGAAAGATRVVAGIASPVDAALAPAGAIAGRVSASDDHAPLSLVEVEVRDGNGAWIGYDYTDADGSYDVTGLPPSASGYYVCFDARSAQGPAPGGYSSQCYDQVAWDNGAVPSEAAPVPVQATVTTDIDAQLLVAG